MTERAEQRVQERFHALTGTEKAAMFMLSLGTEGSSALFENMEHEEIREITSAMSSLGNIEPGVVELLFIEFADLLSSTGSLLGTADSTERFLLAALDGDQAAGILDEMRGPAGRTIWEKLYNVNEEVLANYLKNEYPQTVAVVLSKIKSDHAAKVLAELPENFANEVIMRLLRMEAVQRDILEGIEKTLRIEFMSSLGQTSRKDPHQQMAEIVNALDSTTGQRIMGALEKKNADSAEKITNLLFTFEDLVKVDPAGIQVLMRQVEKEQLAMALKGADDEIRQMFFGNMSERAGKIMEEDMEALGAVRKSEVDQARSGVMDTAKTLSDEGQLVLPGGGEDDELMY